MTEFNRDLAEIVKLNKKYLVRLFDCSGITTRFINEDHTACLIDLYFYDRFVTSGGVENLRWSPERHLAAWNRFVEQFNRNPQDWSYRHSTNEEAFYKAKGKIAVTINIHCICVNSRWPYTFAKKYRCPMCPHSGSRSSRRQSIFPGTSTGVDDVIGPNYGRGLCEYLGADL